MGYTRFDRWVARQRFRAALPYIRPQSRVCDLGCGLETAFLDYAGARIASGVAIDDQLRIPRGSRWECLRADITHHLPLETASFDHVVMLAVLEHLTVPQPVLSETFRLLRPGGSLILTWPQAVLDPLLHALHRARLISHEMESQEHQPRLPLTDLQLLLRSIGFSAFRHRRFELGLNNLLVAQKPTAPTACTRQQAAEVVEDWCTAPGEAGAHPLPRSKRNGP